MAYTLKRNLLATYVVQIYSQVHQMWTRLSLSALTLLCALLLIASSPTRAQSSGGTQSQTTTPPFPTPARITQAIDEKNLVTLQGNVHPLARHEFDQGAVSDAMPMNRILLLLQRSPEQEQALEQLLEQQQSKSSPNYHAWLTPQQFGQQFGPADADIQTITQWLNAQGFSQIKVGAGRTVIELSGNAAQVRSAFHTEIHRFLQNGEEHTANVGDPQIPAALAPVVAGIVSLHNFPKKSHARVLGQFHRTAEKPGLQPLQPLLTFPFGYGGTFYGVSPGDFATIYNSKPLLVAGNDGTGQSIAVVGETNIKVSDVQQFRSMFGLSANFTAANVILNGEDPGITSTDEETEADLDVEWSGAGAPGATIQLVVSASTPASAGIDLSALYIIENNLAGVMSESYGACEKVLGTGGNAFYNNLWEQAAAQGITVVISSGDGGSAGCDDFNSSQPATQGLAVSGFASTPYNVSVGGTDFDQVNNFATYWNSTNDATGTSARSYIPEIPWNENCAQIGLTGCGASAPQGSVNIVAGSGGPSSQYGKPKWQLGVAGMPSDNRRDQPDISLFASSGFNGSAYVICQTDRTGYCSSNSGGVSVTLVGGKSGSAPAFAGIMALVNQKQSTSANPAPRQGNANDVLYALAKLSGASCASSNSEASTCIFNDVLKGNSYLPTGHPGIATNSVPCKGTSLNCSVSVAGSNGVLVDPAHASTEAWTATAGYDMTTGLGSVNANNLASQWGNVSTIGTTTTLNLAPTTGITHGTTESVTVNIAVKANSGTGVPTGDVSLIATFSNGTTQAFDHFTLANGAVTAAATHSLPGGTYNVTAHYAGDGPNASSDSAAVPVTVNQEPSQTFIVVPTFDSNGNLINGNAASVTYGSNYIIRMYVTNGSATGSAAGPPSPLCTQVNQMTCPTGTVTLTGNATNVDKGVFSLNNAGYTRDLVPTLTGGTYSLNAQYSGDNSYNTSSAIKPLTVQPSPTSLSGATSIAHPTAGVPFQLSIFGYSQALRGVAPTGTVTFFEGSTQVAGPVTVIGSCGDCQPAFDANASLTIPTGGSHTITVQYTGDSNYSASSTSIKLVLLYPTTATINVSPTALNYGGTVSITATINTPVPAANVSLKPTGNFNLFAPDDGIINNLSTSAAADSSGNWELQVATTIVPSGTEAFTLSYTGDSNYAGSDVISAVVTVNIPDFTLSPLNGLSLQPVAGQAASGQITITPLSSTASTVNLSLVSAPVISGYSITLNPQQVNLNGAAAAATISFTPVSGTPSSVLPSQMRAGLSNLRRGNWWLVSLATGFASCFLFVSAGARKNYQAAAFTLSLLCIVTFALGCGGGASSTTTGVGGNSGGAGGGSSASPVPTSIALVTSNAKVAQSQPFLITATVTSTKPLTGNVTFYNFGVPIAGFPISNGEAQVGGPGYINNIGLYQITASYSGDANNQPSTSSALTQVITGTFPTTLQARTGSDVHTVPVIFGLQ